MSEVQPPSNWHPSAATAPIISDCLPAEVVTCLQNARFLHLATCTSNRPHVSLMNYTYLPSSPHPSLPSGPLIIMTSSPSSRKTLNLISNPAVSLLVHDWVSCRPPTTTTTDRERSPVGVRTTGLAAMLMQMNSAAVSSISATINGEARLLAEGSEEEKWCKEQHLANNTFDSEATVGRRGSGGVLFGARVGEEGKGDGGRSTWIEEEDVRVVVVGVREGRISDWKGGVKDWVIRGRGVETEQGLANGDGTHQ